MSVLDETTVRRLKEAAGPGGWSEDAREIAPHLVELRGRWTGQTLSAENRRQLWIPEGFAHGFLVLSEAAEFLYKTTDYWHPEHERCIRWDDPDLAIAWPALGEPPRVSAKDAAGLRFRDAVVFDRLEDACAPRSP